MRSAALALILAALHGLPAPAEEVPPFEFRDGDRVALIGDALIEREGEYGYIETALTIRFPDRSIAFRNLGWSGDTPAGIARAAIDPAVSGWERLQEQIRAVRPTVAIIGYGMASSFDGEAGLPRFDREMNALLDALPGLAGGSMWVILLGPIRHENLGPPWPDPAPHNAALAKYNDAIKAIAAKRGATFVSLFDVGADAPSGVGATHPPSPPGLRRTSATPLRLTDNGIHLNERGYQRVAAVITHGLIAPSSVAPFSETWLAALRYQIVLKNKLVFERWRPQNAIYLFGTRKQEQGQHVRELPLFDPLVAAADAEIARLRRHPREEPSHEPSLHGPPLSKKPTETAPMRLTPDPSAVPPLLVADGFEAHLFAATPQIAKPIQMNFDPQGRLWIVTSSVYPQVEPGQPPDDKVVVLEDGDGDGRADNTIVRDSGRGEATYVIADHLRIPTGVVPGHDGCYVGHGTQLLHIDRYGRRRIVLSGFGTEDTHHMIHTLRWGPDGRLNFTQSIYINSSIETPHGVVRLPRGGVFRLDPATLRLDVFVRGHVNSWGHAIDAYGESFFGDASGTHAVYHGVPGAAYFDYAGGRRFLPGIDAGRQPKTCGMEFASGRHLPDDIQGDLLAGDFKANRVRRFALRENGSTFAAEEKPDLVRSSDRSFRPVDVKMGPDGAIYVADWSNPIINHGEVDFRDPRRDKKLGRIWRITAKGRALVPRVDLPKMTTSDLLPLLDAPEGYTREQARRVLAEQGQAILPEIEAWTRHPQTGDRARLEAAWLCAAVGANGNSPLPHLLRSPDPRIRAAAVRVLGDGVGAYGHTPLPDALDFLAPRIADEHPRVRLEAVRALGKLGTARAAGLALTALDKPMDPTLDYALRTTMEELAGPWVAALESGEWKSEGREAHLEFALGAIPPELGARALGVVLRGREIPRDGRGPLLDVIARSGGPEDLRRLLDRLLAGGFDPPAYGRVLATLGEAARLRGARPSGDLGAVGGLLDGEGVFGPRSAEGRDRKVAPTQMDEAARAEAVRLLGRWKMEERIPTLLAAAGDVQAAASVRAAAFEALREIGGQRAVEGLRPLCAKEYPYEVRRGAVAALAALDAAAVAPAALEVLAAAPDEGSALHLWRDLLAVGGAPAAIASALPSSGLPPHVAKAGLRAAKERWESAPEFALALTRAAGLGGAAHELAPADLRAFAAQAVQQGDPERGEGVFRRRDLRCLDCHAIGGAGGKVGPDLGALGAAAPVDIIAESVLYPSRKIKEGFEATLVRTADERVFTGRPVRDDDRELTLLTGEGREVSIAKRDIAERTIIPQSIMPAGLADALAPAELLDLVRFLSELGRPGAYDATKPGVARVWRVGAAAGGADPPAWADLGPPAYARVDGRLPIEGAAGGALWAGVRFRTVRPGAFRIAIEAGGAEAWLDGRRIGTGGAAGSDEAPAAHTLILRLDAAQGPRHVRLVSPDAIFLAEP